MTVACDQDVLIIGAGPTGLCLAAALRQSGLSVCLLERQPEAAIAAPAYDGREIALTWKSVRILRELGVWQRLPGADIHPLRGARVLNGSQAAHLDIRASGATSRAARGSDEEGILGYLVSNHRLREAAFRTMRETSSTRLIADCAPRAVRTDEEAASVTLPDGQTLRARLLVAADSRFSATRRALGIPARHRDFGKTMLVCRMEHENDHEQIACEWFSHHQTLATLPLGARCSSVVVTLPHTQIERLMAMDPAEFAREMERRFEHRWGRMSLASERFAYPLVAVYPDRFIATRCATIGDAAVGMHPVTAHGFNLGLVGQETLARLVTTQTARGAGSDPGSAKVLEAFNTAHRRATLPLFLATNAIVRLYTDDSLPARFLRATMTRIASSIPPVSHQLSHLLAQGR